MDRELISSEERFLLERFFKYALLYEAGIYTLLGSKPVSEFYITYPFFQEKSKWRHFAEKGENFPLVINKDDREDIIFFRSLPRELRKKVTVVSGRNYFFDQSEFLERWDLLLGKIKISPKYILIKKELPHPKRGKEFKLFRITFVNVVKTALVLQRNYSHFRNFMGFDFNPIDIVFEINSTKSEFWEKLRKSPRNASALWGILFGYGEENSFFYSWKTGPSGEGGKLKDLHSFFHQPIILAPSIKHFPIPYFASFRKEDPFVESYKKDRKRLKKLYQGKDFLEYTLERLAEN